MEHFLKCEHDRVKIIHTYIYVHHSGFGVAVLITALIIATIIYPVGDWGNDALEHSG